MVEASRKKDLPMMLRLLVTILMIGSPILRGQAQSDRTDTTVKKAEKIDHAEAYYQYALACMYARLARSNPENISKAIEHHKAAVKADPHAPPLPSWSGPIFVYPMSSPPHEGPGSH